jgi:serine/threonine protein kinase
VCPVDGAQTKIKTVGEAAPTDPLLGRMVGSYRLTRQLGKGGMGAVYMGEHPAIGSKVAVKFLHPQYATMHEVVTRFFNEAKAVNLIKHDNIVQVLDYFYLDEEMPCFIMEYLEKGYPMTKLVGKPVPLEITGPIFLQVCDALYAAHDKQIVHRDLKPDNIFLAVRNYRKHFVKVMDFGIAKLSATGDGSDSNTQLGQVLGTPSFMSPEQAAGKVDQIGPASDIYSLGMIMYQLAVGRVPFKGALGEVIAAHLYQNPPPPREQVPEIPEAYEAIILKAVAKKPEERFKSMRELGQAILGVMRDLGISTELPPEEGDNPGSEFVPSSSLSPFPTRGGRPGNLPTHVPDKGAAQVDGPTAYPNQAASASATPAPASASASASATDQATLIKSTPDPAADQATQLKSPTTPPVAGNAGLRAEGTIAVASNIPTRPQTNTSRRWLVAGVAFVIGVATPIVLVKTGVVSVHSAAKK